MIVGAIWQWYFTRGCKRLDALLRYILGMLAPKVGTHVGAVIFLASSEENKATNKKEEEEEEDKEEQEEEEEEEDSRKKKHK